MSVLQELNDGKLADEKIVLQEEFEKNNITRRMEKRTRRIRITTI